MDMVFRDSDGDYVVVSASLYAPEEVVLRFGPLASAGFLKIGLLDRALYLRIRHDLDTRGFAPMRASEMPWGALCDGRHAEEAVTSR
jgi:hypothetical protein